MILCSNTTVNGANNNYNYYYLHISLHVLNNDCQATVTRLSIFNSSRNRRLERLAVQGRGHWTELRSFQSINQFLWQNVRDTADRHCSSSLCHLSQTASSHFYRGRGAGMGIFVSKTNWVWLWAGRGGYVCGRSMLIIQLSQSQLRSCCVCGLWISMCSCSVLLVNV